MTTYIVLLSELGRSAEYLIGKRQVGGGFRAVCKTPNADDAGRIATLLNAADQSSETPIIAPVPEPRRARRG